jgi:hypothetical protein
MEGLRRDRAAMVYTSQINPDLHVRFVSAATIACCHELILSTARARNSEAKDAKQNNLALKFIKQRPDVFQASVSKPSVNHA